MKKKRFYSYKLKYGKENQEKRSGWVHAQALFLGARSDVLISSIFAATI